MLWTGAAAKLILSTLSKGTLEHNLSGQYIMLSEGTFLNVSSPHVKSKLCAAHDDVTLHHAASDII